MPVMRPPVKATGPPRPSSKRIVRDLPQAAEDLWRRLFLLGIGTTDGLEPLHGYRLGGYCPVHLQDELHNGRYRIIHKLGHGGYSTVWLCRDQRSESPSYVAIKILIARASARDCAKLLTPARLKADALNEMPYGEYLCLPLGHFESYSANGKHICIVYTVLRPLSQDALTYFGREYGATRAFQDVSRQIVGALALLHDHNICHGDLRPSNILLRPHGFKGLQEADLLYPWGAGNGGHSWDFDDVRLALPPHTQMIDLGQSFDTTQGLVPSLDIPANYGPPEVILDKVGSQSMDLWSLGCTLYEIRTGQRLFNIFQPSWLCKSTYFGEITSLLGPPMRSCSKYYEAGDECLVGPRRLIQDQLAGCHNCNGAACSHPRFQLISEAESATLAHLLEQLLRYQPEKRLSAQHVLEHEWFHTDYSWPN